MDERSLSHYSIKCLNLYSVIVKSMILNAKRGDSYLAMDGKVSRVAAIKLFLQSLKTSSMHSLLADSILSSLYQYQEAWIHHLFSSNLMTGVTICFATILSEMAGALEAN
jgi:hypothetical protein